MAWKHQYYLESHPLPARHGISRDATVLGLARKDLVVADSINGAARQYQGGPGLEGGPFVRVWSFFHLIWKRREMIWSLAIWSFRNRFIGTSAGALWSVFHPLALVFVFWMVFSLGFRATGPGHLPFVVYFMTAFLPWTFFSEALINSTGSIVSNPHLAKKMVFPTEILPLVEIVAATFSHLLLLAFTLVLLIFHGIIPGWWFLQILYAYFCAATLVLGLGWLFSATNVIYRDVSQSLNTVLNFWFWITPIVWSTEMVPEKWRPILNLNPMTHVVESYRDALLYGRPFWSDPIQVLSFWGWTLTFGFIGAYVFHRLKQEFAEVL